MKNVSKTSRSRGAGIHAVDFHTHIGRVKSFARNLKGWVEARLEDLIDYMNDVGVDWAVVLSLPHPEDNHSRIVSNEELLKIAGGCGGRIIPFCSVDPRWSYALRDFKRLIELGCKGLGELKVPLRIDDPRLVELLRKAEEEGTPSLIHIEEGPLFYYCYGVEALRELLTQLRELKLVLHGPGWWRHISATVGEEVYPRGRIEEEGMVQELMRKYDNIYADISATSGLNALTRDLEYAVRFLEEFQDRILFGTDFPCVSEEGQFGPNRLHLDLLFRLELPRSALRKILRENAEKLLA